MGRAHTASHRLPVSYGFGHNLGGLPQVYCPRCRAVFDVDADWLGRSLERFPDEPEYARTREVLLTALGRIRG